MFRKLIVAGLILAAATPGLAGAASFDVRVTGQLTYLQMGGTPLPLRDVVIEVWESDTGDDDLLGTVITDYDGYFSWAANVVDRWGFNTPTIYLVLEMRGSRITLGSEYGPTRGIISDLFDVDTLPFESGYYTLHFNELIGDDESDVFRRSTAVYEHVLLMLDRAEPPGRFGVWFSPLYTGPTEWNTSSGLHVNWDTWTDRDAITRALATGIVTRLGDLSGAAPPPGGSFLSVTNPGYAWDEGVKAFLAQAMDFAFGMDLESGVPVPAQTADGPQIAATVAACLWDLYDDHDEVGFPGYDGYEVSLPSIVDLLEGHSVTSLQGFWDAWKSSGRPKHLPVQALRLNGVDFNTPPVWTSPDPVWISPGAQVAYELAPYVTDAESSDDELVFSAILTEETDPVTWSVSGHRLYATMNPEDGVGHAFWDVAASDGIVMSSALLKIIWTNQTKDPPDEIEPARAAAVVVEELSLSGSAVMRGSAEFVFALPSDGEARLRVFDVGGRLVETLADGFTSAGRHRIVWDGGSAGGQVPQGVYFVVLHAGNQVRSLRTVLVR